jgi:hypothetical protein
VEEAADVAKGSLRLFEEGEERIATKVLYPRPPGVEPGLLEDFDQAGDCKRALGGRNGAEGVEAKAGIGCRIEEHDIRSAPLGNPGREPLYEVAVRIDDRAAVAIADVLPQERFEQRGLAGAGLPDHIHMGAAVGALHAEEAVGAAAVGASEEGESGVMHPLIVLCGTEKAKVYSRAILVIKKSTATTQL